MNPVAEQDKTAMARRLLDNLVAQGISLSVEHDKLRILTAQGKLGDHQLQQLKSCKEEIIALLLAQKNSNRITLNNQDTERYAPFPLTDIQRAYWVGHQNAFDLGNVCIHFYAEVSCKPLDVARLNQAINKSIARHDMLRAIVDAEGNQCILEQVPQYQVEVINSLHLSAAEQQQRLQTLRQQLSHSNRDAGIWPGFSFTLVNLGEREDILMISVDLLHVDGGSLLILFDEIHKFYSDDNYDPQPLDISYRDYVLTEHELQKTQEYQRSLDYWTKAIKDLPPAPALPKRKNPVESNKFSRRSFELAYDAASLLKERAAALSITPSTLVMMAFAEVVRQWSSSDDFCLNVTLFNRIPVHAEINKLIGDFTSMILLKIDHHVDEMLCHKAVRIQRRLWEHLEHRTVSGVKVLGELGRLQGYSQQVKMPIVFTSLLDLAGQGLPTRWLKSFGEEVFSVTQTPQVSLDHQVMHVDGGAIRFSWDVIDGLFPEGMIDSMFLCYEQLIKQLISSEEIWNEKALALADPSHQLLIEKNNDTGEDYDRTLNLAQLVERAAQQYPESPALINNNIHFSYAELLAGARTVASALRSRGVASGAVVAVMMEKGWEQILAVLGIHQAACAYLPIDVDLPAARIQYQLENSGAAAVICQPHRQESCKDITPLPVIALSKIWLDDPFAKGEDKIPATPLAVTSAKADDLSHVIYTSGSTGKPKGVMIEHRQVVNRILDINKRFAVGPGDKIIALTALHHDLSVYDIFGVLGAGGTLVMPDAELRRDPAHWYDLLQTHQVSLWNSVPAFLDMLLDYMDAYTNKNPVQSLRFCILAGDWIPVKQPNRMHAYWPQLTFVASGGPTETTIWDIYNIVDHTDEQADSIPYGKPLANAQYHILDAFRNPCPVWVPGEMYIAGDGVTRGYINNPELTAERYVHLPDNNLRCFKSGDMGRYLPDGTIEFLGRNDFQVKIRGLRIELPEIEAVALQTPGVESAVAMIKQTPQGPRIRLWVAAKDAVTNALPENHAQHLDDEQKDFAAQDVAITDAAERLLHKLEYKALAVTESKQLLALPPTSFSSAMDYRSRRDFTGECVPMEKFSEFLTLLKTQPQTTGELKFAYGSAGGLYPVQIYIHIKPNAVAGLDAGLYRYLPREHALAFINNSLPSVEDHYSHNRPMAEHASFTFYFVEHLPTIVPLYGDLASSMSYLEVGMLAQVLRTHAPTTGFGTCQVGGLQGRDMASVLELTGEQQFLCCLVAGPVSAAVANQDSAQENINDATQNSENNLLVLLQKKLQKNLLEHLPEYMQPNDIEILASMPLTVNGKVDRKALNERELVSVQQADIFVEPENNLESVLVEVFESLLSISPISTRSNFFDLGANSALIVSAYQEFKQRTGVNFKLIAMFQYPTVVDLVAHIQQQAGSPIEESDSARASRRESRRLNTISRSKKE